MTPSANIESSAHLAGLLAQFFEGVRAFACVCVRVRVRVQVLVSGDEISLESPCSRFLRVPWLATALFGDWWDGGTHVPSAQTNVAASLCRRPISHSVIIDGRVALQVTATLPCAHQSSWDVVDHGAS